MSTPDKCLLHIDELTYTRFEHTMGVKRFYNHALSRCVQGAVFQIGDGHTMRRGCLQCYASFAGYSDPHWDRVQNAVTKPACSHYDSGEFQVVGCQCYIKTKGGLEPGLRLILLTRCFGLQAFKISCVRRTLTCNSSSINLRNTVRCGALVLRTLPHATV